MTRSHRKAPVRRRPWIRRDVQRLSTTPVQLEALLMAMPSLPRTTIERAVERMIDRLDAIDGDTDSEPYGDELDGTDAEDEALTAWALEHAGTSPGCSISDEDVGDCQPDMDHPAYSEDQSLGPVNLAKAAQDRDRRDAEGLPHPKLYSPRSWPPLRLVPPA